VDRPRRPEPAVAADERGRIGTGWFVAGAVVLFGLVGGLLPAAVAGVVAALARAGPSRLRSWLVLVPAAFMAATAAYVVAKSLRYPIPADLDWPASFSFTDALAWSAVAATVTLVAAVTGRTSSSPPDPPR
jgi:hypothetical protein